MNILSITAGAATMYCGSCLRDNALAAELIRQGHQVTLLPVYTPTRTDEPNVSAGRPVLFGGISVYLQQHVALFRHTPRLLDRLWDAPAVIRLFASRSIQVDPRMLGALTVSTLRGESGYQRKEVRKLVAWLAGEPAPDVVNLPNSLLIALAAPIKRTLGRPVVVTLQGEDLFLDGLPEPHRADALRLIREHAGDVDAFIAVSEYYRTCMAERLGLPLEKIRTVPLGVTVGDLTPTPRVRQDPFTVGFFARIAPEKGLQVLAEAYALLRHERGLPPSRLVAAGYLGPEHHSYLDGVQRTMERAGLEREFAYLGAVDRAGKIAFLHGVDVVSLPAPYPEPKGLSVLEAMACGVPVVVPAHGAFPEMIRATGGGLLARSATPADIADAILEIWKRPAESAGLGRAGAEGVRAHYDVARMARRITEVYREVTGA